MSTKLISWKILATMSATLFIASCGAQLSDAQSKSQSVQIDKPSKPKTSNNKPLTEIVLYGSKGPNSQIHFHNIEFDNRNIAIEVSESTLKSENIIRQTQLLKLTVDGKDMAGSAAFKKISDALNNKWNVDLGNFKCAYSSKTQCDIEFSFDASIVDPKPSEDDDIWCSISIAPDNSVEERCQSPEGIPEGIDD